jgi:hypothetical protein
LLLLVGAVVGVAPVALAWLVVVQVADLSTKTTILLLPAILTQLWLAMVESAAPLRAMAQ